MRRAGFHDLAIHRDGHGMDVVLRETRAQYHRGYEQEAQNDFLDFLTV